MLEVAGVLHAGMCARGCPLTDMWCPGHRIPYNSYADAEAKASVAKPRVDVTEWMLALVESRVVVYVREDDVGRDVVRNGTVY